MAKRRKPRVPLQPFLIEDSPWTRAEYKPLRTCVDRSKLVIVYNGSCGRDRHIAWYDFEREQWRNNYGEIKGVTHWANLLEPPVRRLP